MTTLRDVEETFARWLLMTNTEPLKVALATIAANRLPGDPHWQFLVAPPSGLKTEIIRSLTGVPEVYPLSSMTAQTFASGFTSKGRKNPSLLFKLDGRVLTLKDFTSVLSMPRDKRSEILAQLREVYDGAYHKEFGNGEVVDWVGRIGLLAGVTPILDVQYTVNQVLGERFLLYRIKPDPPLVVAARAMSSRGRELFMREELHAVVRSFFAHLGHHAETSIIGDPIAARVAALACLTARSRSGVRWNDDGEMDYIPAPEGPGRLAKQFATLAEALALIRGSATVESEDYAIVHQVALDTVPAQRLCMLDVLRDPSKKQWSTTEVGERSRYPTATARRYLEELVVFDLVDREVGRRGYPDLWQLSDLAQEWMEKAAPSEHPEEPGADDPPF